MRTPTLVLPRQRRLSGARSAALVSMIGGVTIAIGIFLPWAYLFAGLEPLSGWRGMTGKALLISAALVVLLAVLGGALDSRRVVSSAAWLATGAFAYAMYLTAQLLATYHQDASSMVFLRLGPGLFTAIAGGLIAASPLARTTLAGANTRFVSVEAQPARLAGLMVISAGIIHFAAVGEHMGESTLFGWFFVAVGLAQLVLGWMLFTGAGWRARRQAILLSLSLVALWIVSRTVGIPFGPKPWVPEQLGFADVAAAFFEVAATTVLFWTRGRAEEPTSRGRRVVGWITAVAIAGVTVFAVLGVSGFWNSIPMGM